MRVGSSLPYGYFIVVFLFSGWAFGEIDYPDRLQQINQFLYRGARPSFEQMRSLKNELGIATIVSLDDNESVVKQERQWADQLGIELVSIPIDVLRWPENEKVDQILIEMLKSRQSNQVYLHCRQGKDRTGLMTGLYRVFYQKWSKDQAYREMREMGFSKILFHLKRYYWYRAENFP